MWGWILFKPVVTLLTFLPLHLRQSGTPREGRHHQHQRRADRLSQRRERCYKRGQQPADSGEARQWGRDPHHRSRGDWTLTSRPDLNNGLVRQSIHLELALSVFFYQLLTLQKPEQRARACVDTYISTTSFALLLSPPPAETRLQLNRLTYQLLVSSFEKKKQNLVSFCL